MSTQLLQYIVENEEVQQLANTHQEDIANIVAEATSQFIETNFQYVVENLEKFMDLNDFDYSYESIKQFAKYDYIAMIDAITEVAAMDESFDHVSAIIDEGVSTVFAGFGYGAQKAQRLITSSYE
jgi:hypothetical protein